MLWSSNLHCSFRALSKENKMRYIGKKSITLSLLLLSALACAGIAIGQEKDSTFALQRGYRTGYSDGYMAGYRDTIDSMARSYGRHEEYKKANRTYTKEYGSVEDFRDGYQQGFEGGYDT